MLAGQKVSMFDEHAFKKGMLGIEFDLSRLNNSTTIYANAFTIIMAKEQVLKDAPPWEMCYLDCRSVKSEKDALSGNEQA